MGKKEEPRKPSAAIEKRAPATEAKSPLAISNAPDYLNVPAGEKPLGKENISREMMEMPIIKVCQDKTPQHLESNDLFIEDLECGDIFNTLTKVNYGNDVLVVPLYFWPDRAYWESPKPGSPLLCRARDNKHGEGNPGGDCSKCRLKDWREGAKVEDRKPLCTQSINFFLFVISRQHGLSMENFGLMRFNRTNFKNGQHWVSLIQYRGAQRHIYAGVYSLKTAVDRDGDIEWHVAKVDNSGWIKQEWVSYLDDAYRSIVSSGVGQRMADIAVERSDADDTAIPGEVVDEKPAAASGKKSRTPF